MASDRATTAVVEVDRLCKRYDGPLVVEDVSFTLQPGEFLTLLGPSGSGKTSTMMMVAGFERPTAGDIRVGGRSVVGIPPQRRSLGIVFQSYALFPHMSVLDNVAFALRMRRIDRAERNRQAMDMLERVGLSEFAQRRPRQLSGGQQQRVALARALVFDPEALLLDEPLGALDKALREQLQREIKSIQQRMGVAALFVTHDQSEAMMMSDRIAVMRDGRIEQIDTPTRLTPSRLRLSLHRFLVRRTSLPANWIRPRAMDESWSASRTGRASKPTSARRECPPGDVRSHCVQSAFACSRPERTTAASDRACSLSARSWVLSTGAWSARPGAISSPRRPKSKPCRPSSRATAWV